MDCIQSTQVILGCTILLIVGISVGVSSPSAVTCPADYAAEPPLILVSLDGFRASYLDRDLSPTLKTLRQEGVSVPFIRPTYPTVTFPNHYTIVTVSTLALYFINDSFLS